MEDVTTESSIPICATSSKRRGCVAGADRKPRFFRYFKKVYGCSKTVRILTLLLWCFRSGL